MGEMAAKGSSGLAKFWCRRPLSQWAETCIDPADGTFPTLGHAPGTADAWARYEKQSLPVPVRAVTAVDLVRSALAAASNRRPSRRQARKTTVTRQVRHGRVHKHTSHGRYAHVASDVSRVRVAQRQRCRRACSYDAMEGVEYTDRMEGVVFTGDSTLRWGPFARRLNSHGPSNGGFGAGNAATTGVPPVQPAPVASAPAVSAPAGIAPAVATAPLPTQASVPATAVNTASAPLAKAASVPAKSSVTQFIAAMLGKGAAEVPKAAPSVRPRAVPGPVAAVVPVPNPVQAQSGVTGSSAAPKTNGNDSRAVAVTVQQNGSNPGKVTTPSVPAVPSQSAKRPLQSKPTVASRLPPEEDAEAMPRQKRQRQQTSRSGKKAEGDDAAKLAPATEAKTVQPGE